MLKNGESYHPVYVWRQATPADQLVNIHSGMAGWLHNLEDGTSTQERAITNLKLGLDQLKDLYPFLVKGAWDKVFKHP